MDKNNYYFYKYSVRCINTNGNSKIKYNSKLKKVNLDKKFLDRAIYNFIKGVINNKYKGVVFFEDYYSLIRFIQEFDSNFEISTQSLSNFKKRKVVLKSVFYNEEVLRFYEHIKKLFPLFDKN